MHSKRVVSRDVESAQEGAERGREVNAKRPSANGVVDRRSVEHASARRGERSTLRARRTIRHRVEQHRVGQIVELVDSFRMIVCARNERKSTTTGLPDRIVDQRVEIARFTETRGRFEAVRVREATRRKRRVGDLENSPVHQKRQ